MMASSLREKFKLLRQWQIQQQEDFLRKTMQQEQMSREVQDSPNQEQREEIRSYSASEKSFSSNNLNENDYYQQSYEEKAAKPGHRLMERMSPGSLETLLRFDDPPLERELLQRMTSNSLEHALSLAMNELESQGASDALEGSQEQYRSDDVEQTEEHHNQDMESEANEMEDSNSERDSWSTSGKLQTVIFKPKDQCANPEESSDTGSLHEMDGFYPIVYSEDNLSHGGTDDDEIKDAEMDMEMTSQFSKVCTAFPLIEMNQEQENHQPLYRLGGGI